MTGSLQISRKKWYVVVRMLDAEGKQKYKWFPTEIDAGTDDKAKAKHKREAEKRKNEILAELDQQKIVYSADILFLDWIDKWMEQKKNDVRMSTFESYELQLNAHIIPFFKPLKLSLRNLAPQHIQDYYNGMLKKGLSANTIHHHRVLIHGPLAEAVKKNLVPYNVAERATLPKKQKFLGKFYTDRQSEKLLSVLDGEPLKPCIILGLFYGLRRSEVLGLRFSDIDFEQCTIQIRNTVVRVKTLTEVEQTKSQASKRTLYIIPETKGYLLSLSRKKKENRLLFGESYHAGDHVCTWDDGSPFDPDYVSRNFKRILVKNKLPVIRFHELRHTAGSLLLARGLSIKQVQEFLGHEKASTTLDIYGHVSVEGKKETANAMGAALAVRGL